MFSSAFGSLLLPQPVLSFSLPQPCLSSSVSLFPNRLSLPLFLTSSTAPFFPAQPRASSSTMYLHCRPPPYRTPATVVDFSESFLASPIAGVQRTWAKRC
ncbi:uncharacterized protein G2W53_007071 [Senna tora]|uniref:Secreted protein n=1 Tax=Senna tora TaxID=362788 RepID=A0A835CDU2_9FABA|nr:uncharacterized protein G2W53_007071 [Senna tora]